MSFPYLAALSWRATTAEYASTSTFNTGQSGMTEDGSLWRLCKAGADLTNSLQAKINAYTFLDGVTGDAAESALAVAIVADDMSYTMTDATNARAANYYKGGYSIQPRSDGDNMRYIWKSDAESSDTYKIHVTAPFTVGDAKANTIHTYPNPWGNVKNPNAAYPSGNEHFVCEMVRYAVTSGKYFWGQVRGPHWCWFAGIGGNWPGKDANDRTLAFHINGAVDLLDRRVHTNTMSPQIAGYLMFSGDYGDVLTFLQIE